MSTTQKAKFTLFVTTLKQLRAEFWQDNPAATCKRNRQGNPLPQNAQPADTRMAFCEYVEHLQRSGVISAALADRATL